MTDTLQHDSIEKVMAEMRSRKPASIRTNGWADRLAALIAPAAEPCAWRYVDQPGAEVMVAITAVEILERELQEAVQALDDMCRQHCHTDREDKETDSGAISANADALYVLEKYKRFRVTRDCGRMVVGYYPENEPLPEPPK